MAGVEPAGGATLLERRRPPPGACPLKRNLVSFLARRSSARRQVGSLILPAVAHESDGVGDRLDRRAWVDCLQGLELVDLVAKKRGQELDLGEGGRGGA